jgi:SAM-dependent methyltransferase
MFVCPDCKAPLEGLRCTECQALFSITDGIPVLLSRDAKFQAAGQIGDRYDSIYAEHSDVWNDQGRTPEFIKYFASLLESLSTGRVLEIGCGEGYLLSAVNASEKVAIDISAQALRKARSRTNAQFGVALAERLPFPDCTFDLVFSVGVMEHFLDDGEATREICRVLRSGGTCATLLHVDLTSRQRLALKFSEYVWPNFRPLALARWMIGKLANPIIQPIQRRFSIESARACLDAAGLHVYKIISKESDSKASLSGPHVTICLSQKPAPSLENTAGGVR